MVYHTVCAVVWLFSAVYSALEKDLPQTVQLWGFSLLWIDMCFFMDMANVNDLLQILQLYDFSSLWLRMCLFMAPTWTRHRPCRCRLLIAVYQQVDFQTAIPGKGLVEHIAAV
jgi:hypothetical protein